MFTHLDDRQLALLGEATRQETLALVGWMALANAFGTVTDHSVRYGEELPSRRAVSWVGSLSRVARLREAAGKAVYRQQVLANRRRKIRVRRENGRLATGK